MNKLSVKLSEESLKFLKKLEINIIKAGDYEEYKKLSYSNIMDKIVRYFKSNNNIYLSLITS